MAVVADATKCNACLKCTQVCPTESIKKVGSAPNEHVEVSVEQCIDCCLCVGECANGALSPG